MSLYKCSCGIYYTNSKEMEKEIGSCVESGEPVMVVGECPTCGEKRIVGGELDVDFETGKPCVLIFGDSYRYEKDKSLPVFQNIILEECDEVESEFSTYSNSKERVVHLKKN